MASHLLREGLSSCLRPPTATAFIDFVVDYFYILEFFIRLDANLASVTLKQARVLQARKALALDPNLPEALAVTGAVQFIYGWDWHAAHRSMELGLAGQPSDPAPYLGSIAQLPARKWYA